MTLSATPPAATAAVIAPSLATEDAPTRAKRPWGAILGVAWLVVILLLTILGDRLPFVRPPTEAVSEVSNYGSGPSRDFWFGSDRLGRDIFSRCVAGARISLLISVTSIVIGLVVGTGLGMICGHFRGRIDRVMSVFVDSLLAFPAIILAALIVGRTKALSTSGIEFFGIGFTWVTNTWAIISVFALLSIAPITRIVRAQTMSLTQREYVLAARSLGAGTRRILLREILPNVVPALVSVLFTGVAILLAAEAGLAFLGYSVAAPAASWGLMVAENREFIATAWWATVFPCLMLFLTVLSFNLIGDHIARHFDIREAAL